MKKSEVTRAGTVQFDVTLGNIESNLQRALEGIGRVAEQQADIAVLPELWACGFDGPRLAEHAEKTPEIIEILSKKSREHKIIIAGSLPENENGRLFNTMFLFDNNGQLAGKYQKIHLFSPLDEHIHFQSGSRIAVVATSVGPIGLMICYDLRFPEVCRSYALQGAQMVLVSAQWPARRIDHWNILLRARAIENQIFIIACNRCGRDGDLIFNGHSQIISPYGKILANAGDNSMEMIAEMDLNEIDNFRDQFDCLAQRAPNAYYP